MALFFKKQAPKTAKCSTRRSELRNLFSHFDTKAHGLADRLQKTSERYSKRKKTWILVLLTVALTAYNGWLIIRCFYYPSNTALTFGQISMPLKSSPIESQRAIPSAIISDEKYQSIMRFKDHLDSLSHTRAGRIEYQDFMRSHPGFSDSLLLFQQLYHAQRTMAR